jgi:hypothetical protein
VEKVRERILFVGAETMKDDYGSIAPRLFRSQNQRAGASLTGNNMTEFIIHSFANLYVAPLRRFSAIRHQCTQAVEHA